MLADKHESLLQTDSMVLMGMIKHSQSSQNSEFAMPLQYLKKEVKDEVDFLHVDKHQIFVKVYFNSLGIIPIRLILSLLMDMIKHSQVLKVTSFQYLYNISKKKLEMEAIFDTQINVKFSTGLFYPFWWKWPDMSNIPKIGSW